MTILVADDLAIVRELVATCLQVRGYTVICANDGVEALKMVRAHHPALIVCDISMPQMDGIKFLEHLRADPATASMPVILLTGSSDKELILKAARLGVTDYLLKSRFSVTALIDRVKKALAAGSGAVRSGEATAEGPAAASSEAAPHDDANAHREPGASPAASVRDPAPVGHASAPTESHRKRLDRDECVHRIKQALRGETLAKVIAQIIALVSSPAGDVTQLANLITRDGALTARLIDAANASAPSDAEKVTTVSDAARQMSFPVMRAAAVLLRIFDAIPRNDSSGFNPIRYWQHSIATALFCEQLEMARNPENAAQAFAMGLCHDLGEILLHSHFSSEWQRVIEVEARGGKRGREAELHVLGMTRQQLLVTITQALGLSDVIRMPIEAFHNGANTRDDVGRLCGILRLAESYANALHLAPGPEATVMSFARPECRGITGVDEPTCSDPEQTRAQAVSVAGMLARLRAPQDVEALKPFYPKQSSKIWLARDPALSTFDPIQAALSRFGEVHIQPRLPSPAELQAYQALAVTAWKPTTTGFTAPDILKLLDNGTPLLWSVGRTGDGFVPGPLTPLCWPISLRQISDSLDPAASAKRAA